MPPQAEVNPAQHSRAERRANAMAKKARAERWERRKTVAGWIVAIGVPLGLGAGGWLISIALKDRESQTKFIELSVSILSSEPKPLDDYKALRKWAVDTLTRYSEVPLPDIARTGLENSIQLNSKGLRAEIGTTLTTLDSRRGASVEMTFGNLITDALRASFDTPPRADFAIITSNSFRGNTLYPAGTKLTRGDFLTVMPFANAVTLLSLTGAQIRAAIEETANQPWTGGIPQVSGLAVKYAEDNGRVVITSVTAGGQALVPDKEYLVATTDFNAAGHIRQFEHARRVKHRYVGRHIYDIALLYMYEQGTVSPTIEGRISKVSR